MSKILKINPFYSENVWCYERWSLLTHRNWYSTIHDSDITLINHIQSELPILKNIIWAEESLSVQVHIDDDFSREYENNNEKTEFWYILGVKEDASLICGIKDGHTKAFFVKVIENYDI